MSQSHGSSHASDSLCDSGQGSIYSDSGSASSDFSATSATDFNLGQLKAQMAQMLSFLRSIDTERRKWREERRKCRRILLGLVAKQQEFDLILKAMQSDNRHFQLPLMAVGSIIKDSRLYSRRIDT